MTSGEAAQPISEEEINEFSQKLQTWGQELSARERGLLHILLTRASEGDDVQGYSFGQQGGPSIQQALTPVASQFLLSPGFAANRPRGWVQMGDPWLQRRP